MFNIAIQKLFVEQAVVAESILLCSMRALETKIREPPSAVKSVQLNGTGQVVLVPFELSNGLKPLDTYAYLDNGICQSLLLISAISELEIDINTVTKMSISGYHTTREIDYSVQVSVQIKPYRSQITSVVSIDVLAVPDLNMTPVKTSQLKKLCNRFDHLKHITLPMSNKIKCL